ncbi:MAG: DUF368 domain-containing protein [Bacteroidota bacterium]
MKSNVILFLKGLAMGAANVIPGVSGGTIALITGIYEELIDSVKSFDLTAIQKLLKFDLKGFWAHINGTFLLMIFGGIAVSIVSLAKILEILLEDPTYEKWVMAFFFGLILLSVYFVGKTVQNWNTASISAFVIGTGLAVFLALMVPSNPNDSLIYLMICGVIAMCSMILPGLSGSFVLIILGNYELIMVKAVSNFDLEILIPVAIGAGLGLLAFSRLLSWVFKNYKDVTISTLTGFVLGSLLVIWPWKQAKMETFTKEGGEIKEVITGYSWHLPDLAMGETWVAFLLIVVGGIAIWAMERWAASTNESV